MKYRTFLVIVFLSLISFFCSVSLAANLTVPSAPYPTIQDAIDAADPNDVITVSDGTYTGTGNKNLDFGGKAITVQSLNGRENCIIDCQDDGRGFYFHNNETADSIVSGFTIRNGLLYGEWGAGIYCRYASPTIQYCDIQYCDVNFQTPSTGKGGGLAFYHSDAVVYGCTIQINSAQNGGGGAYFEHCSASVADCLIKSNTSPTTGAGIETYYSTVDIQRCTIIYNQATDKGGGIYIYEDAGDITPNIINTVIVKNTADQGGGIWCRSTNPIITNCTLANNPLGHALYAHGTNPAVTNCIVWGNRPAQLKEAFNGNINATYCDVEGGWAGTGNIDMNPQFEGREMTNDYHIKPNSPAINTGTDTTPSLPLDDRDSNPRPYLTTWIDMGAYEFQGQNTHYVTTTTPSSVTTNSASSGGTILCTGCMPVTAKGVCWSKSYNPTIDDSFTSDGIGSGTFTSTLTGLTANTAYYNVRAYAISSPGISYGDNKAFTTFPIDSCPDCIGDAVVFRDRIFPANSNCDCNTTQSITFGPNVIIESLSRVRAVSQAVTFDGKVEIKSGADFKAGQ